MQFRHPRRLFIPLFLALVPAVVAPAQDRFAGLPDALRPFVTRGEISGAVMLVANPDRVLHRVSPGQLLVPGSHDLEGHSELRQDRPALGRGRRKDDHLLRVTHSSSAGHLRPHSAGT